MELGASRYRLLWLIALPLSLWALIRLSGLDGDTVLAPLMAFTPYAAIVAFLFVGVCIALRNWAAAIVAAASLVLLGVAVLPRAFGSGEEIPPGATPVNVLSANLYLGRGDTKALLSLVGKRRPDLLAVQEMSRDQAAELRELGIRRLLPDAVLALPADGVGRGIYSRLPLRPLPTGDSSSTAMPPLAARFPHGEVIRLVNVHPHPPQPGRVSGWNAALKRLPTGGRGAPWLLIGDFNATLDQSAFRDVLARGYRDVAEETGMGLVPTWPSDDLAPPLLAIDHILADRRLGIAGYGVQRLPGTDHMAISATLFLRGPAG